jgi:putative DNA primase/helicase
MELRSNNIGQVGVFGTSEVGTAMRFANEWGDQLAWCKPMKEWLVWSVRRRGVWTEDVMLDAATMMRDTCNRQYEESNIARDQAGLPVVFRNSAGELPDPMPDGATAGAANPVFQRRSHQNNAMELAKSLMAIHPDGFDKDAWELNTPSGVVDLRTGSVWPHRSGDEDTFLSQCLVTPSEGWDPSSTPLWNKHLSDMCKGNEEWISYLQRLAGMSLVGDQNEKPQLAVQLNGLGRNGKGIYLQTICDALGDYGLFASDRLLTSAEDAHTTDQTDLQGKRIVVIEEVKRINPTKFNDLTGGGVKSARKVGKDNIVFRKTWTVYFNNNGAMNFTGSGAQSEGTKERITTIDFGKGLPKEARISDWAVRLRAEFSGILAWAIEGCLEWQRGGGDFVGLRIPKDILAMTEQRQVDADPLRMYLEERYEPAVVGSSVSGSDFVRGFTQWCKDTGNVNPGGHKFVYQDLRSHHGLSVEIDGRGRTRIYGLVQRPLDFSAAMALQN